MDKAIQFLLWHGYAVLFTLVFAEQIGLPLPATPILLAIGALAASGQFSFVIALLVALLASVLSDLIWYELGRRRGRSVLNIMCRISLEPDSCVRYTENAFARHGARALLFAKFVPGLNTAAPPLAGMLRMPMRRFLMWTSMGGLLWAGGLSGAGYFFHAQLRRIGILAMHLGTLSIVLMVAGFVGYAAWKYLGRDHYIRRLHGARLIPAEMIRRPEIHEGLESKNTQAS